MANPELGRKIKDKRTLLGLSQEDLAAATGLTIRTIQRIESGQTVPRGDSLKRIAAGLEIEVTEITNTLLPETQVSESEVVSDPKFAIIMTISAFAFLMNAVLGLVLPLIVYFLYRNTDALVRKYGKEVLWIESVYCAVLAIVIGYKFAFLLFRFEPTEIITYGQLILFLLMMKIFNVISIVVTLIVLIVSNKRSFWPPKRKESPLPQRV